MHLLSFQNVLCSFTLTLQVLELLNLYHLTIVLSLFELGHLFWPALYSCHRIPEEKKITLQGEAVILTLVSEVSV